MRVVFVAPFGLRHKTTVWARTLPLARALVRRGWQATILIPPWDSPEDSLTRWNDAGVELVHVEVRGGLAGAVAQLLRAIGQRAPDFVHIVKPRAHAGIVQWLLWQRRGGARPRMILDIDDWEQAWAPVNHYPAHVARFLAWQEEWGIRHAHGITAASHWLAGRARDYATVTPILYLPNGIDLPGAPAAWSPAPLPPTVLHFTRYVEVTPEWLAGFAAALFQAAPQARLVVAGSPVQPGLDAPFRAALATRNPAGLDQVTWLGSIARESLPGLYAATAAAIFPADPVPLQMAKCSVRLASTLLNGVPVVASAVGEQAHYGAQGAADLVPAGAEPVAFAAAVTRLLTDGERQRAMVAAARSHLEQNYQWDDLGGRLAAFYASFCAK